LFYDQRESYNEKLVNIAKQKRKWFIALFYTFRSNFDNYYETQHTVLTVAAIAQLTMQFSQILSLAGSGIGVITIVLGIVALSTPTWLILTAPQLLKTTYSLFERCNKALSDAAAPLAGCTTVNNLQAAQGLIIAGVVATGLGIIGAVLLDVLINNRWIKLMPQLLLVPGPTLIIVGALFYVKNVLGNFTSGAAELELGYSFILIVITCIIGYLSAGYFLFVAGYAQGYDRGRFLVSPGSKF
jgi:hypothetical protein